MYSLIIIVNSLLFNLLSYGMLDRVCLEFNSGSEYLIFAVWSHPKTLADRQCIVYDPATIIKLFSTKLFFYNSELWKKVQWISTNIVNFSFPSDDLLLILKLIENKPKAVESGVSAAS